MHRPQAVAIVYANVTKLIKWKHLYVWLLQRINGLKPLKHRKMCQVCLQFLKYLFNHCYLHCFYVIGGYISNH